jgi:hypothetical protein
MARVTRGYFRADPYPYPRLPVPAARGSQVTGQAGTGLVRGWINKNTFL